MDTRSRPNPDDIALSVLRGLPGGLALVFALDLRLMLAAGEASAALGLGGELAGRDVRQALARDWPALEPLFLSALEGRGGSLELQPAAGDRWFRVEAEPLRDGAGAIVGGVAYWRDISESKQLEGALEQQARLLDLAHDAVIVREPRESRIAYWNREACDMYGYTAAEATGRVTHELLATAFPVSRRAVDEALLAHGRWDGELWHSSKDGARILVASRQALVRSDSGEPLAIIELNSDITERRQAEQELRRAEERFRGLVESAPDALVIADATGEIVLVNARAERLFGFSRAEVIGRPIETLMPAGLGRRVRSATQGGGSEPDVLSVGAAADVIARRSDGSSFMAEVSVSPVVTDNGLLISAAIRDVSRQLLRQLEQSLVPRMRISDRWQLAWRYRPTVSTMLLGGDFIGACERSDGSLSLLIGDVTGHGPAAAGTGAMLRAAWLGAAQADVALETLPELLHRLLSNQAARDAGMLATVCLADIDEHGRELRLIRAGHDSPVLITPDGVSPISDEHGPALGLSGAGHWPAQRIELPREAAIMMFTDGLTERRTVRRSGRVGFDELLARLRADALLDQPPGRAIDALLADVFPQGTERLDDDLAVILLKLGRGRGCNGAR